MSAITAVVGPTIQRDSYQVAADMRKQVLDQDNSASAYFYPDISGEVGKYRFDLPGYICHRLGQLGIRHYCMTEDTYADATRFFSHRRRTHRGEADTGRLMNIIGIKP